MLTSLSFKIFGSLLSRRGVRSLSSHNLGPIRRVTSPSESGSRTRSSLAYTTHYYKPLYPCHKPHIDPQTPAIHCLTSGTVSCPSSSSGWENAHTIKHAYLMRSSTDQGLLFRPELSGGQDGNIWWGSYR